MGVDKYPKTLQESYHILQHYKFDARDYQSRINKTSGGMAFINNGQGNKKDATNITLWNFQKKWHYANDCPDKNNDNDDDSSRQSVRANVTNWIWDETVMLQESVHVGEFDLYDVFSTLSFFNELHEIMQTE